MDTPQWLSRKAEGRREGGKAEAVCCEGEFRQLTCELPVRPQGGNVGWRARESLGSGSGFRVIYSGNSSKLQMEITSLRKKGRKRTENLGDTGTIKRADRGSRWCWIIVWENKPGHFQERE